MTKFNLTDDNGRAYCEITLPGGRFIAYEDNPHVYTQVLREGEKSVVETIMDTFNSGALKQK